MQQKEEKRKRRIEYKIKNEGKRRENNRREIYFNECFWGDILNLVLRGMNAMRCNSVMWN